MQNYAGQPKTVIIPSILTLNRRTAARRIELAKQMGGWIHIDFLDHSLYLFESLAAKDLSDVDLGDSAVEAHAMTNSPKTLLDFGLPIERIVIHVEMNNWQKVYTNLAAGSIEPWLAIAPATKIKTLDLPRDLGGIVVMGVEPGQTGQPFLPATAEKIAQLKDRYPDLTVSVDGGVGAANIRLLVAHGADNLILGSAIFDQTDPVAAYHRYERLADPLGGLINDHQAA